MAKIRGLISGGRCGTIKAMPFPEIEGHCIIDSHMHIQSNRCAPKPLQAYQLEKVKLKNTAPHAIPVIDGLHLGRKTEIEIGNIAVSENRKTYDTTFESTQFGYYKNTGFAADISGRNAPPPQPKESVFTIMVAQMMDMEYAHIAGYDGQKIYHEENGKFFYYKRNSGLVKESEGEKVIDNDGAKDLKIWKNQYLDTRQAIINHPWNLMVMYKYEPRRWRYKPSIKEHPKLEYGPWNFPFTEVATTQRPGVFCGFKMYSPLGFQPCDPYLTHLWKYTASKKECFFGRCEIEKIPILSHCSPGGMPTHELMYYHEFYTRLPNKFSVTGSSSTNPAAAPDATAYRGDFDRTEEAENWFYNNFVHPSAWRKVLEKFPNLKLCLAHFGGDLWTTKGPRDEWIQEIINLMTEKDATGAYKYPNIYTDVSCWNIKISSVRDALRSIIWRTPELKKRLLFGSDWHMILLTSPYCDYDVYCKNWKYYLDGIDDKLWVRLTLVNPFEFYGFVDEEKIFQMKKGLKAAEAISSLIDKGFNKLLEIRKEVENLKKALEQWDAAGF